MTPYLHKFSSRLIKGAFATLCTVLLVGTVLFGTASSALAATEGTLSEAMDLKISQATQEFVASVLDEYEDSLSDAFKETLKPLKSVTKDLTKQFNKVALSPTADTAALAPKLAATQTALETAAEAFQSLVADTETFKTTLSATPDQLKEAIDTQLGTRFDDLQTTFDSVATALSTLSGDVAALDPADAAAAVGKLTEDSTALAQAIELAKTAISSFGD